MAVGDGGKVDEHGLGGQSSDLHPGTMKKTLPESRNVSVLESRRLC